MGSNGVRGRAPSDGDDHLFAQARRSIEAWATWVTSLRTGTFILIVLVITMVKSGINLTPIGDGEIRADIWPAPSGALGGSSLGMRSLAMAFNAVTYWEVSALGVFLSCIYVLVVILSTRRLLHGSTLKLALILSLSSPAMVMVLSYIGRHDVLLLLGSWIVAISPFLRRPLLWTMLGVIVMNAANPEQATVAGGILLAISRLGILQAYRLPALITCGVSAAAVVLGYVWSSTTGVPSRITYWPEYLGTSLSNFARNIPLDLYAGYGILWLIILMYVWMAKTRMIPLLGFALLFVPVVIVATTIDQTRVFVGVTSLALVAMTFTLLRRGEETLTNAGLTGKILVLAVFILALLLPALEIDQYGQVRNPYGWFGYLYSYAQTLV